MGDVDYRLLTSFVNAKRANADARAGKRDVDELLALLEDRVRSYRSVEPVGERSKGAGRSPVQPDRDG
jgi:hypothetical protein